MSDTPKIKSYPQPRNGRYLGAQIVNSERGETWLEGEDFCYPNGGKTRRAFVRLRRNEHNPVDLPYGKLVVVWCGIPDTFFSIPASLRCRYGGDRFTVKGFVSVPASENDAEEFCFTPKASPKECRVCQPGDGCRKGE